MFTENNIIGKILVDRLLRLLLKRFGHPRMVLGVSLRRKELLSLISFIRFGRDDLQLFVQLLVEDEIEIEHSNRGIFRLKLKDCEIVKLVTNRQNA